MQKLGEATVWRGEPRMGKSRVLFPRPVVELEMRAGWTVMASAVIFSACRFAGVVAMVWVHGSDDGAIGRLLSEAFDVVGISLRLDFAGFDHLRSNSCYHSRAMTIVGASEPAAIGFRRLFLWFCLSFLGRQDEAHGQEQCDSKVFALEHSRTRRKTERDGTGPRSSRSSSDKNRST